MRYETFGIIPNMGQWKWKKERAMRAIKNYRKFENEFKNNLATDQYEKLSKDELEFLKNKSLLEYRGSNGQTLLGPLNCVKY
jgi:adenine-specific DNA-methyltransferase